jgi:methionine synthase I (cobalamin-dependent)
MSLLLTDLIAAGPALTDGAWGTQLQARGLPIGGCADVWNLEHPDRVEAIAHAYIAAGSQILLTNTFQANRFALARHGLSERAVELNRAGALLSRRAAGSALPVFGAIGPTGLPPGANCDVDSLVAAFREQAEALAEGGVDGLVLETFYDLAEARRALAAAKRTGLPTIVSLTFGTALAPDRTLCGATPEQAATVLADAGADGIGANCGFGPQAMLPICERLRAATALPLWIKPNAGLPAQSGSALVYPFTPEAFVAAAWRLVEAGADFIGGCCGTTPEHLRALAALPPFSPA